MSGVRSNKRLFADDLDEHTPSSIAVELAIENLYPRAEIQPAIRNRDHDFPANNLTFEMRVGIVFTRLVVVVARSWRVRRKSLQRHFVVVRPGFYCR